ncbi:probable phospholipid hydroperoxide glutathione peroxidase [Apis laboriosa]|uniref:probable phospholipid hydroperoxide glutathione peroxidase n=1 Tax=Apis laboriosa TaxID=183418 RepID=UPI001CC5DC0B|nr:probable phospholipid hydroperoxide glutathione peroxidase [Apis laboriosa]XP_043792282.1 probable phospholipid hydroperoxide glutathione peroxidase [Apis laboriosa]XP_043792283.1 probable phospholipid hydroperoxide glutathione peroxidase [Apis laboriosa]XP_043792284.1 probable phospholipid hydroperoxide glutathione peroxidase [Apis laboriosa]
MQKLIFLTVLFFCGVIAENCEDNNKKEECALAPLDQDKNWKSASTIYDFHAKDIHGNDVSLNKYHGHVCIIVNVASNCGLTDTNYRELVQLYEKYNGKEGLRILAFPSNEFGGQEPGTSAEILEFVKKYNVTFDLFEKINVNGDNAHPLWKWLKTQANGFITDDIKWNFSKFIINKEGKVVSRFAPTIDPLQMESELKKYF